jgi:glycosyltransferase involved in cell wall biosynthesis
MARILSDRLVVLSDEMITYVERELPRPAVIPPGRYAPVERIYSLVDLERMRPPSAEERITLRQRLGIVEGTFAVGVIAAFVPKKQQLELIRHIATDPGALLPPTRLYFVGDFAPGADDYARSCLAAAGSLATEGRIRFVGFSLSVVDWYKALDVVLVPSREEGLARCMIEGIACGTPVISFEVCSAREILERGPCGVVVSQGDFSALLTAVTSLASDIDRRAVLGRAGATLARRLFAPEVAAEAYTRLYENLARR